MTAVSPGPAAFCIAGTHSGCGKTTVSLGVMAALRARGCRVQAFKVGPDFIDPGHHRRVTGRPSHNLDGWMLDREANRRLFDRCAGDADVAVVEGVMGLFDGFSGSDEAGSTAQMAKWLGLPVILVIDARAAARSAAAVALGFARFDPGLRPAGVVFNRVGSRSHAQMLTEAVEGLQDVPVYGCLEREDRIAMPSRHLGLVTDEARALNDEGVKRLADWVERGVDLDRLLRLGCRATGTRSAACAVAGPGIRIGIAMDEAFSFYYEENLRLLREAGAEAVPFSPLKDGGLPDDIQGLILGGGYPELHCEALTRNRAMLESIRAFGRAGRPIYAECGGLMVLSEAIHDESGRRFPMAGLFPMEMRMEKRLRALGYREVVTVRPCLLGPAGTVVRGHEFHYSGIAARTGEVACSYRVSDRKGAEGVPEGYAVGRVLGSYVHLHWGSNPEVARHFVKVCGEAAGRPRPGRNGCL